MPGFGGTTLAMEKRAFASADLLQPFTTDRDLLRQAVERVRAADMKASPFAERPEMTTYQADFILRNGQGARQECARRLRLGAGELGFRVE